MPINWFPGHMNKARRKLKERAAKSDMVLEVLDARLPRASQNPMLAQICGDLPCLRVLTKPDMADPRVTEQWLLALASSRVQTLALDVTRPKSRAQIVAQCRLLVPSRGSRAFPVRVMIAGIPNVGKSTIFNLLAGRRKATVRDQPAVTRDEQRIEVEGGLSLIDTPGVLWPKLDDEDGANRLAASGAVRDAVLDSHEIARFIITWLSADYPDALSRRYDLDSLPEDPDEVLVKIAERRGCFSKGVGHDLAKAAELLLVEVRSGRLGRLSFERPGRSG